MAGNGGKIMKRYLIQGVLLGCILALAIPAWSATIYTINAGATTVGEVDPLVNAASLPNSGYATELAWVQGFVPGASLTVYDAVDYSWVLADGQTAIWASALQDSPDYFFIKTGAGAPGPGVNDHFLFQNLAELNYAVVNFNEAGVVIRNIGAISHVGETNGTSVPEAGALITFASGLIGLVGYRRMRRMQ